MGPARDGVVVGELFALDVNQRLDHRVAHPRIILVLILVVDHGELFSIWISANTRLSIATGSSLVDTVRLQLITSCVSLRSGVFLLTVPLAERVHRLVLLAAHQLIATHHALCCFVALSRCRHFVVIASLVLHGGVGLAMLGLLKVLSRARRLVISCTLWLFQLILTDAVMGVRMLVARFHGVIWRVFACMAACESLAILRDCMGHNVMIETLLLITTVCINVLRIVLFLLSWV